MKIIEISIGLIFIYLILSLLATAIQEVIAALFNLRGKNLRTAILRMLTDGASTDKNTSENELFKKFMGDAFFKQIQNRKGRNWPSYMHGKRFVDILLNVLLKDETDPIDFPPDKKKIQEKLDQYAKENKGFVSILSYYLEDAEGDFEKFKTNLENWYNDTMDRVSGWYKRNAQFSLFIIGLALAAILNVDSLSVFDRLDTDADARNQLVALAEQSSVTLPDTSQSSSPKNLDSLVNRVVHLDSVMRSVVPITGIGWEQSPADNSLHFWLFRIWGWLLSAVAVSLGAPFWFDLLQRFINLRNAGVEPSNDQRADGETGNG